MKNFKEFMENVSPPDEKPMGDRVGVANQRFEIQKQKAREEIKSTKEKIKSSQDKSVVPFNKQKSVKFNKSTGELPSLNKKGKQ